MIKNLQGVSNKENKNTIPVVDSVKISELKETLFLNENDIMPVVQNGETKKFKSKVLHGLKTRVIDNLTTGGKEYALSSEQGKNLGIRVKAIEDLTPVWQAQTGVSSVTIQDGFEGTVKDLIIKGKTVGGYDAETAQSEHIVSSAESEGKLIIKSVGKNLIPFTGLISGTWNTVNQNPSPSELYTRTNELINIKYLRNLSIDIYIGNKKASGNFLQWDVDKKLISNTYSCPITILPNAETFGFHCNKNSFDTTQPIMTVHEGTLASNYEPYIEDKKEILLPIQYGLKGVKNTKDIYNSENGILTQNVERIVIDGVHNKVVSITGFNVPLYRISCNAKSGDPKEILGDNIKTEDYNLDDNTHKCIYKFGGDIRIQLSIADVPVNNPTKANEYFSKNPLTVIYPLETPIVHNIEKLSLPQYDGTTHIIQENEVAGDISCKAKVSLSAQNNRLKLENRELKQQVSEEQFIQDSKITTTMLANTELFEMIIGLVPMKLNKNIKGGEMKMVEVYVTLIIQGDKTLDQVPSIIRPQVEAKLRLLGVII
ncbi:MAG: CD1375 family protein [Sarcina sp.]